MRSVLAEVLLPLSRVTVAGKDHVGVALLLVAAVHHVKEQPGILLVKLTVSHLINNQAGRADKVGQKVALPAGSACGSHAVPQLCHLNEVTPKSMLTAGTPKSLGQMGLARTRPSNKGKVFVSIEGRQRGEATELVNILSGDSAEIKVVKGLGSTVERSRFSRR